MKKKTGSEKRGTPPLCWSLLSTVPLGYTFFSLGLGEAGLQTARSCLPFQHPRPAASAAGHAVASAAPTGSVAAAGPLHAGGSALQSGFPWSVCQHCCFPYQRSVTGCSPLLR